MSTHAVLPDPNDPALTHTVEGVDETGRPTSVRVIVERPLTIFLDNQEVVTAMTIGDHPDLLALGYLKNQALINSIDEIAGIEVDSNEGLVVVRTHDERDVSDRMRKRVRTSGCAQGTVFADVLADFDKVALPTGRTVRHTELMDVSRTVTNLPSLYLEAGAIHGAVLCQGTEILAYFEDVGRHNAVDKVAGWMLLNGSPPADKLFYTTGRLTSEMVIKTVMMGIPILASRSGFTAWGVQLARQAGLTLIGRMKGKRLLVLSGKERVVLDQQQERAT